VLMKNYAAFLLACVVVAGCATVCTAADYLSPLVVIADKDGQNLYIAEYTANQVAVFSLAERKVSTVISLPDPPTGLALSPDQSRLYVTGGSPAGRVHIVDLTTCKLTASLPVGHTPVAPVLHPDGRTLYVCNRFNNDVSVIDLATVKELKRIPVSREPVAAVITPDGRHLFVANLLPAGPADVGYTGAVVSVIDTAAGKVTDSIDLPNGSTELRGVCISPDSRYVYVTHILGRYQMPTTQLERGWMNTNALSIIDVAERKLVNTVLLDDIDLGAANPWAVACTSDGKYICVTHAGTHELSRIDREALHHKLANAARGLASSPSLNALSYPEDVPNDLGFLVGLRRRIPLAGNGPRGLALVGNYAYVAEYFSDSIAVVDILAETADSRPQSIGLGSDKPMTLVRRGEMLFHDATMCFQHWQSCSTCHPDARADGLNWDLLNDGMGNPKNTKSLLLAHKTPPAMITGIRPNAETAVRSGIRFIQFVVRPEEDAAAIDAYLKSLKLVPSPYLVNGELSEAARRGKAVFEQAHCASCHSGPLYTDRQKYDVELGKDREKNLEFDTPTLVEVWRTAPYLYDGRAATIKEVLTKYNPGDTHGATSGLSEQQINDLVEFVLTR